MLFSRSSSRALTGRKGSDRALNDIEAGNDGKSNDTSVIDKDGDQLRNKLENLDLQLEADPFVPKSDFFTYDETDYTGSKSYRHGDNKTRHSRFSPLPAPPPDSDLLSKTGKRSKYPDLPEKPLHSIYSPLPRPESLRGDSRLTHRGESDVDSEDGKEGYNYAAGDGTDSDRKSRRQSKKYDTQDSRNQSDNMNDLDASRDVIRHQPTPSNIAYKHSRY